MISLLDKYLHHTLKHHTRCMSSDNEYVILLRYAICLNIDLTMFPTLWAVLSILLETQDVTCEHVKCLQEEYDTYYADKPKDYMLKLERQSVELQNHMYHSVTHNFDRVSAYMTMAQPLYRGKKETSQLRSLLHRMPLMMML